MTTEMLAEKPRPSILYPHQLEALFFLTLDEPLVASDLPSPGRRSEDTTDPKIAQARLCLWMTYHLIKNDTTNSIADTKIIWWIKRNYHMESSMIVACLKGLESIFECVKSFSYNNDKKCKTRYTVNRCDSSNFDLWCEDFEKKNKNILFVKSKLVAK
tara:strand:+ start:45982 stop:46455 length:474 start_codon:yes stop_codon:yes gene_type:complete